MKSDSKDDLITHTDLVCAVYIQAPGFLYTHLKRICNPNPGDYHLSNLFSQIPAQEM
jgi:hypothetical protein